MAVKNLYPNLPGHLVEFKDGGLQLVSDSNQAGYDKSLLILGTAFDGPINEPVKIDSTTVSQLFGPEVGANGYPNGATLTKYAKQAFRNGFSDVRCMRVTGSQAYVEVNKSTVTSVDEMDDAIKSITVAGNAKAADLPLSRIPMLMNSLKITTQPNKAGTTVTPEPFSLYSGTLSLPANVVTKNSILYASYKYTVIRDKDYATSNTAVNDADAAGLSAYTPNPITSVKLEGDSSFTDTTGGYTLTSDGASGVLPVLLDFDPNSDEFIYVTPHVNGSSGVMFDDNSGKLPLTTGLVVTNVTTGNALVQDTDYTIVGNKLSFILGTNLSDTDTVSVQYYVAIENEVTDTITLTGDADQIVALNHEPIAGSVEVRMNGAVVTGTYTVAGTNVSLTAGQFPINSTVDISYKYNQVNTITESMTVQSIYGGSLYKEAEVKIVEETRKNPDGTDEIGRKFIFTKPKSKLYSATDTLEFTSFDHPTVGILKQALAKHSLNNVFEIIVDDESMATADFPVFNSNLVNGGDDGVVVSNNQMFEALSGVRDAEGYLVKQGAYQILENYHCDYIYVAGVYADSVQTVNKHSDFHYELALLCAVLTYRTKMTHGFIDVKPNSNTTLVGIQKYVDKLTSMKNLHYMRDTDGNNIANSEGKYMDIGWYTSIVVGPEPVMSSDSLGTYYGSPAIAYAALCASLKPQSSPTNKALPGVRGMKYKFSNKQMDALVGNRMVVFRLKNEGSAVASSTPYVVDGMTAGAPNCDYTRISTVKVVTDVVDQIREVADPFIGEPNTVEQRNALAALISKRLSYLMEKGEITHYEFEINATIQQVLIGECTISLTLVCPMELRKITTVVALRPTA